MCKIYTVVYGVVVGILKTNIRCWTMDSLHNERVEKDQSVGALIINM